MHLYWTSTTVLFTPVLLLGIFLYTRWRSYKGLKEGVYHVSAHHDGWEDIRENVLNYDEEGGGEEDQVPHTHAIFWHTAAFMQKHLLTRVCSLNGIILNGQQTNIHWACWVFLLYHSTDRSMDKKLK